MKSSIRIKAFLLIQIDVVPDPSREAIYIAIKNKIVSGAYSKNGLNFLNLNHQRANYVIINSVEDIKHFILDCPCLQPIREQYLSSLNDFLKSNTSIQLNEIDTTTKLNLYLTAHRLRRYCQFINMNTRTLNNTQIQIERITRRMCYNLHQARYRALNIPIN